MKNYELLKQRIDEGIDYIEKLDKKLQPVIDYLVELCIEKKEELPADKAFEFLFMCMNQKTENLLLLTKMREILNYCENNKY